MTGRQIPITCIICKKTITDEDTISCNGCEATCHKFCLALNDNLELWTCTNCSMGVLKVPAAPTSKRSRSYVSRSEKSKSSSSSKAELLLKALQEEKDILDKQHEEKEKLLKEKHLKEQEFVARKQKVLQDTIIDCGSSHSSKKSANLLEVPPMSSKEKVNSWVAANKANSNNNDINDIVPHQNSEQILNIEPPPTHKERIQSTAWLGIEATHSTRIGADIQTTNANENQFAPGVRTEQPYNFPSNKSKNATIYLSNTRPKEGDMKPLTKEQVAARQVTRDLPKFDGEPKDWPKFISSFQRTTMLCGFSNSENLERLARCLKGSALLAVEPSLSLEDNVPRVIEILEMLFGKPEYIINSLIDEMRATKRPSMDNIDSIICYSLTIENISTTMKLAKLSEHLWNPMLLAEMVDKLPTQLRLEWAQYTYGRPATSIEVFSLWLREKSSMMSSILKKPPLLTKAGISKIHEKAKGYVNVHEQKRDEGICYACQSSCKNISDCKMFIELDYLKRWELVKKCSLCRTCLKKHWGRCRKSQPCGIDGCKYFHHEMLHQHDKTEDVNPNGDSANVNAHANESQSCVFKIIPVTLRNGEKLVHTYAMLDEGSSLTLVTQHVADQLEARGPEQELCLRWTSNVKRVESNSQKLNLQISEHGACEGSHVAYNIQCRTVASLDLPRQSLNYKALSKKFDHLRDIPVKSYKQSDVGILIGMNNATLLITKNYRTGKENEPIAAKTKLGWVIFGGSDDNCSSVFHVQECDCVPSNDRIDKLMKENYSIEALGISSCHNPIASVEDQRAYDIWVKTTKYIANRYETGLLFKYERFRLPNSFDMAFRRNSCLQTKCHREPGLRIIIQNQINDYLNKGYARLVNTDELNEYKEDLWYLPIFIVRNPNKPEKIRLVWDAAATVKGCSLNSMLIKGPDLLATLLGVLLRFRQYRIAISGDIQEMFHQIHIRKQDQRYQLFLWTNNEGEIVTYAMVGMTFGASCSPATAQYIKNINAAKFEEKLPRAVEAIVRNHYVDDLLDSVETEEEATQLAKDVFQIHKSANFHIRNWISNSSEVLKNLNSSISEEKNLQLITEMPAEKILGMWWKTTEDYFTFSLRYQKTSEAVWKGERIPTKREVLRAVMSIYDPLGLLSHVLIFPKILLQSVWRESSGWDDKIGPELAQQWKIWISALPQIERMKIPRWFGYSKKTISPELHIFTDSSKEAYSTVAYIRFQNENSIGFHVSIIAAKSRVAPLKYMSVPRLELMGALIGVRLSQTLKSSLDIEFSKTTFWTDSTCVLGWINSDHRKYRPYVAARIGEILENSNSLDWRYVPTAQNAADDATRMKLVDMSSDSRWFTGPEFLFEEEINWPTRPKSLQIETEEMLSQFVSNVNFHHAEIKVKNISSWTKLIRIQVYVHRFIKNLKLKRNGENILTDKLMTAIELKEAENTLYKQAQSEGYPEEMTILSKSITGSIPKDSPIYKEMPYLDQFDVMRAHGRIDAISGVPFQTKRPVLLPRNHPITNIIMNHFHKMFHHRNSETVINELRQKYSIPAMRVKLKSIKNSCQRCKNDAAKPRRVTMGALPEARLTTFSQAFTCIGIDYFGPLFVAVKRSREKRWGILITCLTTRAVHLEVAQTLSTDSCILGLRRFMCRRGTPAIIYSDNATNFKGASKQLQEAIGKIDEKALATKFTTPDTEWSFIPPSSPHMGGAWERMVRCVKAILTDIFPFKFTPNDELLLSVLLEIENIVNSRPLTYVPLENDVDEALTPNHFILGSSNGLKTLGNFKEGGFYLRNSWKQSQAYADNIWHKWIKTILPDLRRREKWLENSESIKVDDIVLVIEEGAPRNSYKKARVIGLNTGRDGKTRSVTIQTSDGIYVRPITKLAVLDISRNLEEETSDNVSIPSYDQGIPGGSVRNSQEQ